MKDRGEVNETRSKGRRAAAHQWRVRSRSGGRGDAEEGTRNRAPTLRKQIVDSVGDGEDEEVVRGGEGGERRVDVGWGGGQWGWRGDAARGRQRGGRGRPLVLTPLRSPWSGVTSRPLEYNSICPLRAFKYVAAGAPHTRVAIGTAFFIGFWG